MEKIFCNLNSQTISQHIKDARERIIYVAPGININISGEIVTASQKIGVENIHIVVDNKIDVLRYGYGDIDGLDFLEKNIEKLSIKKQDGLRIGFFCFDNEGYIFSPTPLCLEEEKNNNEFPNAIQVSGSELNKIIKSILPASPIEKNAVEIGKEIITKEEIEIVKIETEKKTFVKADMQRQMNVINSAFQIVDIEFNGGKLQNKTFNISAKELGIKNKVIAERILSTYKIFQSSQLYKIKTLYLEFEKIKKDHLEKIKDVGCLIRNSKYHEFESSIDSFKEKILKTQSELQATIDQLLEESKTNLIDFIVKNLMKLSIKDKTELLGSGNYSEENFKNYVEDKMTYYFPNSKSLFEKMNLKYKVYNVSGQLMNDEEFKSNISRHFKKPFAEIVKLELALGTKKLFNELEKFL